MNAPVTSGRKDRPKLQHPYVFSVSQVLNFMRCNHKWALEKIDGLVDPGSDSTDLGGLVHDELEKYLELGRPIGTGRPGKIAMSALPFLPPPRFPGMLIEQWFTVYLPDVEGKHGKGAYFQGLKDVEIPKGWRTSRPLVSDHKTTKNFMWAKTPKDLNGGEDDLGDLQAGLYAYDAMERFGVDEVDLQWTYMRTTGPPLAQPTYSLITREQVERIMSELTLTTQEMIRTKDEHTTALTVVRDPTGCDAFGGCYFKSRCNLEPKEKLRAIMTQVKKESSVLQRLKERKAAKSGVVETKEEKTKLKVVDAATDAEINPPENESSPEPNREVEQEKAAKKSAAKSGAGKRQATAAATAITPAPVSAPSGVGVLSRAIDAFWDVITDDLARRIAERMKGIITSPHQSVIDMSQGPTWRKSVPDTPDLRRILSIPRRDWTAAEAEDLAKEMTKLLKVPGGTMDLRPFQAVGLHDLCAYGGLVGMGRVGIGKAHSVSTLVVAPEGLRKIGDLKVGDVVSGSNGKPTKVLGVYPQGELPIFRVHFSDGTYADASEDHLWQVEWRRKTKQKNFAVLTTKQLMERPVYEYEDTWGRRVAVDLSKKRLHIPTLAAPVEFLESDEDLPIEPYDLGVLIANGSLADGSGVRVIVHEEDALEVFEQMDWMPVSIQEKPGCYSAYFSSASSRSLTHMGLRVKSREKFIPKQYLRESPENRIRLLQGLMDCDGSCSWERSKVTYHTASERLADDVQELVELLGGQVRRHIYDRESTGHGLEFRLQLRLPEWVLPFTVTRKASRYNPGMQSRPSRSVVSVEDLGRKAECVCIKVEAEDSLFTLDHGVITHNTLISFLSPYVCEAHRPLLIIPANLKAKTEKDVYQYKAHWEISSMMDLQSYELLARANHSYYLDVTKPDLIICDEAHHLKNTKAAVTRRLKRYLEACRSEAPEYADYPKNVKLVLLSGTFTNRSIKEYWHLLKWVLPRASVPLPLELSELELWSLALDEKVKPGQRVRVGALEQFYNDKERELAREGKSLAAARRAYGRRLVQTPGVVSTTETFSGSKLSVKDIQLALPQVIKDAFHTLREDWQLPDGEPISDGTIAAKAAKELALGFYYKWNPWPPDDWIVARREWCQFVRRVLSRNKLSLDTEEQVKNAVLEGLYPSEKLDAWLKVKDSFEINVEAVWLSDFAVDAAIEWAKKRKGIVWVFHSAFGKRLASKSGLKYYGEGGFTEAGDFIENHPAGESLIASIKANKEGKNLQSWSRNLVCHPPSSGGWWEQMMGRTHRDGQQEALVSFEMFASCVEHYQAFHRALGDAMYTQDSTPLCQKLLYADLDMPSLEDVEAMTGEEWHPGNLEVVE